MARRRRQSPADDFIDLVAMLPWWVGVALALVAYLVLHSMSVAPQPAALQPGQMAGFLQKSLLAIFAFYGQFIAPGIFLLGALLSFLKRKKRGDLFNQVTQSSGADSLNGMSWSEFELLVGEAFRMQGYKVTEQGGAQPDGGVDLILRKGSETFLVQCKQWKAYKVGVDVVRELYGVMAARGAAGGFVVTSGSFTSDAKAFAEGRNVMLLEGPKLFGLIQQAKASLNAGLAAAPSAKARAAVPAPMPVASAPVCPVCASSMVRRTAKKGTNAGSQFWGCSKYPACRGTR